MSVNAESLVCVFYDQVKDCLDHSALPMDGATLTEALHQRGINVRYLGSVLEFMDKTPAKAQLEHIYVSLPLTVYKHGRHEKSPKVNPTFLVPPNDMWEDCCQIRNSKQ